MTSRHSTLRKNLQLTCRHAETYCFEREFGKNPKKMNSRILSVGAKVPIRLEINRALSLTKNGKLTFRDLYDQKPTIT